MFLGRLYQYVYSHKIGLCIIRDIIHVIEKYKLNQYVEEYISTRIFPNKSQWKCIIQSAVKQYDNIKLAVGFQNPKLRRYAQVYDNSLKAHPIWLLEHTSQGHRRHFRDYAKLNGVLCDDNGSKPCIYCGGLFVDHLDHYFHTCEKYKDTRECFWALIINTCNVRLSAHLYNLSESDLSCVMLGKQPHVDQNEQEFSHVLTIFSKLWQILTYERELPYFLYNTFMVSYFIRLTICILFAIITILIQNGF